MDLFRNLHDCFLEKASIAKVVNITVGLRYTAVMTDDGGMGLSFTFQNNEHCCPKGSAYRDYEGQSAIELLENILSPSPLSRSIGLALINALNFSVADKLPEDDGDTLWMDAFDVKQGSHVAMVGFFKPLMQKFEKRGALVEVVDDSHGIGDKKDFYEKLGGWADVLLITATSILNGTTEEVLAHVSPDTAVIMLGPSTPMVMDAFSHLPVRVLAGTVPTDFEAVLKAVRHGEGTPVIHRFSRKVIIMK